MNSNKDDFKNIIEEEMPRNSHSIDFRKNVLIPFLSGIVGCGVVIGTCFGIPAIKNFLVSHTSDSKVEVLDNDNASGEVIVE